MREKKLQQPAGSSGTAKAARIVMSLEALYKAAERVIVRINALVSKNFDGAEEKMKQPYGREVQKLRASAEGENILGLRDALADWHLLNRHVEEAKLLIEEADRFVANLKQERDDLARALASEGNHLLKRQFLQTSRRLYVAKKTLRGVISQRPPAINLVPGPSGSINDFVVVLEQQQQAQEEVGLAIHQDEEDDGDDGDFVEGGDDEEDMEETRKEIEDASLGR